MNKSELTPSGGYEAFNWDMESPGQQDLELTFAGQQEKTPQSNVNSTGHLPEPFSISFESEEYSPTPEQEDPLSRPPQPNGVGEDSAQTSSAETGSLSADIQSIQERAESYEKYKSLFRRVIGKVAHSKGFRKVAKMVATFSLMFALASCDAGVAEQPQESSAVDFIDDIEHNSDTDPFQVDLNNLPDETLSNDQVDLDDLPAKDQSDTEKPESSQESKESKGIYDGYSKKGMWLSQNKGGAYDFASAVEVAEVFDDDECEMIKYAAANQVECFADYLAGLPESLQPEEFKGLTILETEHKLESLSIDEFEAVKSKFNGIIDSAFTRDVILDGDYHNAYMRLVDPSRPATHDNMELVECVTNENGTGALELYFTDDGTANGTIIGRMVIKISRSGGNVTGGCMQLISAVEESAYVYSDLVTVTENPTPEPTPTPTPEPTPTPTPEPTPTPPDETIQPKDPDNLTRIDNNIEQTIEGNIGGSDVQNHNDLDKGDLTDQPSSQDYEGTEAQTVTNDASSSAEYIQDNISDDNIYTVDLGGANSGEYAPVQADQAADDTALQAEIPVSDTYVMGDDISDILSELGIQ